MKRLLGSEESLAHTARPTKTYILTALAVLLVGCGGDDGPVVTTGTPDPDAVVVTIDDLICDTIIVLLGGDCDAPPPSECDAFANALSVACLTEPNTVVVDSGPWPNPPSGITVSEPSGLTATLDWIPPSTSTDGSPLLDLSGYRFAFADISGAGPTTYIDLNNPGLVTYVLDLPGPGEWAISMTAHNSADQHSASSNVVTVIIDGPSTATNPITSYGFITGVSTSAADPTLGALFAGMLVSGTFDYDRSQVATGVADGGRAAGSVIYGGSLANVVGSANGLDFSDPGGLTVVGNDRYEHIAFGLTDVLTVSTGQLNLGGFEINGFTLVNVRLFWIEGIHVGTDFLSSEDLPAALPDFEGKLAFDFTPTGNPGALSTVFFDGLIVSQTP